MTATELVRRFADTLRPSEPLVVEGLTFRALYRHEGCAELALDLLDVAQERGTVEVEETGVVDTLRLRSKHGCPVLGVEGEILVGGRQNRTINTTFAALPGSELEVPTSCVEQGRWGDDMGHFAPSDTHVCRDTKRELKRSVEASFLRSGGRSRKSDQSSVWVTVSSSLGQTGSNSPTSDHLAAYRKRSEELQQACEQVQQQLLRQEGVVGLLVSSDQRSSLEAFGSPQIASSVLPRVVRSALLVPAQDGESSTTLPNLGTELSAAEAAEAEGLGGVGRELRARNSATGLSASAFTFEGKVLHLSASWAP